MHNLMLFQAVAIEICFATLSALVNFSLIRMFSLYHYITEISIIFERFTIIDLLSSIIKKYLIWKTSKVAKILKLNQNCSKFTTPNRILTVI